jgi:hypothetical protein
MGFKKNSVKQTVHSVCACPIDTPAYDVLATTLVSLHVACVSQISKFMRYILGNIFFPEALCSLERRSIYASPCPFSYPFSIVDNSLNIYNPSLLFI